MQDVFATSTARGGRGGSGNAHCGAAHADAVAEGLGLAVAEADANGGRDFFNSAATAKSRAFGNSGTTLSRGEQSGVGVITSASIQASNSFFTENDRSGVSLAHVETEAFGPGPDLSEIDTHGVMQISAASPGSLSNHYADITLGAKQTGEDGGAMDHELVVELVLALEVLESDQPLGLVMFDDAEVSGNGFESLDFKIELGDVVLLNKHFDNTGEASQFFGTTLISLKDQSPSNDVTLRLTFERGAGSGFSRWRLRWSGKFPG